VQISGKSHIVCKLIDKVIAIFFTAHVLYVYTVQNIRTVRILKFNRRQYKYITYCVYILLRFAVSHVWNSSEIKFLKGAVA
jgi:hypothetical protein